MFRRLESGLPKDPVYPPNLQGLGYFVNEKDEVRKIENPKVYFQYFMTKNDRVNDLHREAMISAIRDIVTERLTTLGLDKIRLPLGAKATEPNVPIFVSSDISSRKRVLVLFYDQDQDLGFFSRRIILAKGGINQGSAVNLVKYVQAKRNSANNDDSPGIILANIGQLRWWRRGKKAITLTSWYALPAKSLVEAPVEFNFERNTVPGNRDPSQHVEYVFNNVITQLVSPNARLEIIGAALGAVEVSEFLEKEENWGRWKSRLSAFASIASYYSTDKIKNNEFRDWIKNRGRAYVISSEPCGSFLAGPEGSEAVSCQGFPTFSLGEPFYSENLIPKGYKTIIDWFEEVACDPNYTNPKFSRIEIEPDDEVDPSDHQST